MSCLAEKHSFSTALCQPWATRSGKSGDSNAAGQNRGTGPPRWSRCENALLRPSVAGSTSKATSPSFGHIWPSRYNTLLSRRRLLQELLGKNKAPYSSPSPPRSHVGRKPSLPFPDTAAGRQAMHFASLKPYVFHGVPIIPFLMGTWTGSSP